MRAIILYFSFMLILLCLSGRVDGQKAAGALEGVVKDAMGIPVPFATVFIPEISRGCVANEKGEFVLQNLPAGSHTVRFSSQGFATTEKTIELKEGKSLTLAIELKNKTLQLKDVVVRGKSKVAQVKEQPFAVASIDAKKYHNSTGDINTILDQVSGVRVLEEGGLGSGFQFYMNGLSGDQIRFFIDGIPMEYLGESLSLNNFPPNLIDRVEIYKGVVPVHLGADALGGAVNIVTRNLYESYLDVSYSVGSFNTHRASLNSQWVQKNSGFVVKANGYYNYSDNNYWTNVVLHDPETGKYTDTLNVRRFHDVYQSSMVQLQAGFRDKKWADEVLLGVLVSRNFDEVQHAISLDRVFGEVNRSSNTIMPTLQYRKENFLLEGLNFKAYVSYGIQAAAVVDTSSSQYDWLGNYIIKNNKEIGEASWRKSLFSYSDRHFISNISTDYQLNKHHKMAFNYTGNPLNRVGEDPLSLSQESFENPSFLNKDVLGLSHTLSLQDQKWETTTFAKLYFMEAKMIDVDYDGTVTNVESSYRKPGYGFASTYHLTDRWQLKASFEKAFRIPSGTEMLGDGLLLLDNPFLLPEESYNGNLGALYRRKTDNVSLEAGSNLFIRDVKNMIRIEGTGILSQYVNVRDSRSSGIEGELKVKYRERLSLGLNATYQNLINTTKFEKGSLSYLYQDRIPNIPYFFANAQAGLQFSDIVFPEDKISLLYRARYTEKYFLKWPSQGDPENKHIIPSQFIQDAELIYSDGEERYNISFSVRNFLNTVAYDQFRLQKPGRSLSLKLRYFITEN